MSRMYVAMSHRFDMHRYYISASQLTSNKVSGVGLGICCPLHLRQASKVLDRQSLV